MSVIKLLDMTAFKTWAYLMFFAPSIGFWVVI